MNPITKSLWRSHRCNHFNIRQITLTCANSIIKKNEPANNNNASKQTVQLESFDGLDCPRKIFSGIQPTGSLHLGNYLGALQQWTKLQDSQENLTFCIVDLHSITLPQEPFILRENIFQIAATLMACGIDFEKSTVFVQSAVKEHTELCWVLSTLTTMARLGHLPQYKEKSRLIKEVPLGLFVYPVLQAADILLYKATHVPVGEDQIQHIQLAQHLAKSFNNRFGPTFPICRAVVNSQEASRIRSLRDPNKKMSKSDPDPKSRINIMDEPEVIIDKVKKALTDFTSDVSYEPEVRSGVSNLVAIHALLTNKTVDRVVEEAKTIDTGAFKLRVADAIIAHLKPVREKINHLLLRRNDMIYLLESGAERARQYANATMQEVKQKVGLGATSTPALIELKYEPRYIPLEYNQEGPIRQKLSGASASAASATASTASISSTPSRTIMAGRITGNIPPKTTQTPNRVKAIEPQCHYTVPKQNLRVEKQRREIKISRIQSIKTNNPTPITQSAEAKAAMNAALNATTSSPIILGKITLGKVAKSSASVGKVAKSSTSVGKVAKPSAPMGKVGTSSASVGKVGTSSAPVSKLSKSSASASSANKTDTTYESRGIDNRSNNSNSVTISTTSVNEVETIYDKPQKPSS